MAALTFLAERLSIAPAALLGDESPVWTRLEADLQLASGRWQAAADAYQTLLETETGRRIRAELLRGLAEALCRLDRPADAIPVASESVELFSQRRSEADAALASYWLAFALYLRENADEARSLLRGLLDRIRGGLSVEPDLKVRVLVALSLVESRAAQHAAAVAYLEEARGIAADLDDSRRAAFLFSIAVSSRESGDLEGAVRAGVQALALYRAAGAAFEEASMANDLALSYLALGNTARATDLITQAHRQFENLHDDRWLAHVLETEAQIALARGDVDRALALTADAIHRAEQTDNEKALISALVTRARAHVRVGRPEAAERSLERASALARQRGRNGRLREVLREWASVVAERGEHERAYRLANEALASAGLPD